ncbi:MAG: SDR family NAD(P)-dependent oxidoreductase, partial [Acidimicrobiia bacterium]
MSDLVFITGASSGLGRALADTTPFPATVVDISRSGPPEDTAIEHITADLSRPEEWPGVGEEFKRLINELAPGRIVFIHAAGTLTPIGFAGEVDTEAYAANVVLNSAAGQVLGHLLLQAVAGRDASVDLVMISSGAASSVYAGWSSYGAGKAALDQWVRNVGLEQKERGGARVCAIAPGVVAT